MDRKKSINTQMVEWRTKQRSKGSDRLASLRDSTTELGVNAMLKKFWRSRMQKDS